VQPSQVRVVADALKQAGCNEISLGDTIGVGTPSTLETMLEDVTKTVPLSDLAL
jgi:hydroxymethylglutaryl-CoA lyase